jgi:hypothetical protein
VVDAASLNPPTSTLIDNFESPTSPAPWIFRNGGQTPSASGSLTLGIGHEGHGAHLAFDFSRGGSTVEALLPLTKPIASAAAISFWVKTPPELYVRLRVLDSTGQTFTYDLTRPLEAMDVTAWYQQTVELDCPDPDDPSFGGAADGVIHFPITTIEIFAYSPIVAGLTGAIDFDDVYAVSSTEFDLDPTDTLIPAPSGSGNLLSRLGVKIDSIADNRALDIAKAAGFSWARADLLWSQVEQTQGVYDWHFFDQLISALQTRGMKAVFILDYGNALYTGDPTTPPTTPAQITAFGNFAQAAAQHFVGTGTYFEIWNEPDNYIAWPPAPDPAQYAALASVAISRVHQGDPNALVTTGGTETFDENFAGGFLSLGGGIGADAIGVHPYDIVNPPENFVDELITLQNTISQYLSPAPPVWDTEAGYSSTNYSTPAGNGADPTARFIQSTLVPERILMSCAAGMPIYIYYNLKDDGTDPTNFYDNYGLIANDYSSKPALLAVQTLASVARKRTYAGLIHTAPSSLVAMRFDGPTDQVFAVWTFLPNSKVTVTFPTTATIKDLYGNPLTPQTLGSRLAVNIQATTGPVYITIPSAQSAPPPPSDPPVSNPPTTTGSGGAGTGTVTGADTSASSGGGGGAPSLWFYGALSMLTAVRTLTRRRLRLPPSQI